MKTVFTFEKNKDNKTFEVITGGLTFGRMIFIDHSKPIGWRYRTSGSLYLSIDEMETILEWAKTHDRNGEAIE